MIDNEIDDYLWDQSGKPDEHIRALELLLEAFRFDPAAAAASDAMATDLHSQSDDAE